jgi:phosphoribosyl-AMP cyclohydrolase / phosphoribosyl-ATP pyrophosphohydrolase
MSATSPLIDAIPLDQIRYNEQGLVPAIAQDYLDSTVLMMAWMNRESLQKTLETGEAWYWSRSRQELWHKGATSGHLQKVHAMRYDCDSDALLLTIEQMGDIACHTGERSCFHQIDSNKIAPPADTLSEVFRVICDRRTNPKPDSYTCKLLEGGDDDYEAIVGEVADLFYHTLVALAYHQVELRDVYRKLQQRRG